MQNLKKIFLTMFALLVILSANVVYAQTDTEIYESTDEKEAVGNITYAGDVTNEMGSASYWAEKLGQEADKVLLNSTEIETINQEIIDGSGTLVFDITLIEEEKTQAERNCC